MDIWGSLVLLWSLITNYQVHPVCFVGITNKSETQGPFNIGVGQWGPQKCTMGRKLSSLMQIYRLGLSEKPSMTQWHSNVSRLYILSPSDLEPYLETNEFYTVITLCEHLTSFNLLYILSC